jgi:hypothetical protein
VVLVVVDMAVSLVEWSEGPAGICYSERYSERYSEVLQCGVACCQLAAGPSMLPSGGDFASCASYIVSAYTINIAKWTEHVKSYPNIPRASLCSERGEARGEGRGRVRVVRGGALQVSHGRCARVRSK